MSIVMNSRNGSNLTKVLIILFLVLTGITGLAFLINRYFVTPAFTLKQPVTILLAGEDLPQRSDGFPRLDTLILALIHPKQTKVFLVSIPGASQADPQAETLIGDAGGKEGIQKAGKLITDLTGKQIDHYMILNFQGFQQLVDLLDGIEVNVDRTVKYTGVAGQPIAVIQPGKQVLTGEQALLYVRYLDQKGEVARIARQQEVFKTILLKAAQPGNMINALKIYNTLKKYVKTDLTVKEILQLTAFAKSMDSRRDITLYTLPGTGEDNYWKPDYPEIKRLMKRLEP